MLAHALPASLRSNRRSHYSFPFTISRANNARFNNSAVLMTLREMREDVQSSISYAGGTQLSDIRKVNYVILGGDNAGEHLLM